MFARQLFWVAPVLVLGCRCGGKSTAPKEVFGTYTVDATCVNSLGVPRDSTTTGMLMGAGRRLRATPVRFTVNSVEARGKARVTNDMGCSFVADLEDGVITAQNVPCDPISANTQLALIGIESQVKVSFLLDVTAGNLHDFNTNDIVFTGGTRQKNSTSCEGRILEGRQRETGSSVIQYDGRTRYPDEQDVALGCKPVSFSDEPNGYTNGALVIRYGKNKNELIIYEEGIGCTVTAESEDGRIFHADGANCGLGRTGVAELGVTSRHFDTYALDFNANTWNYASSILRNNGAGATMIQCQVATTQFTGGLPK